jgi:hypothetical protein
VKGRGVKSRGVRILCSNTRHDFVTHTKHCASMAGFTVFLFSYYFLIIIHVCTNTDNLVAPMYHLSDLVCAHYILQQRTMSDFVFIRSSMMKDYGEHE